MNSTTLAFILTILSGLSTMFGCVVIFIKNINHNKIIVISLSFASGVMLCVSLTDLIPESIRLIDNSFYFITILISFISIIFGFVISYFLDYCTSSLKNYNILYKSGILSMIAIIVHNIPEGIITFLTTSNNISLGISLAFAIAIHNIPEGISISVPIYYSTNNVYKAIFYTFISALAEPFGAFITFIFLKNYINNLLLGIMFSFVAGIMINISLFNLYPTAKKYQYNILIPFLLGVISMLLLLLF